MADLFIGYHESISKGVNGAVKRAHQAGANAVQVFLGSPQQARRKKRSNLEMMSTRKFVKEHDMKLICHACYNLNFAQDPDEKFYLVDSLVSDLVHTSKMGGLGVVIHMPFRKAAGTLLTKEQALINFGKSITNALNIAHKEIDDLNDKNPQHTFIFPHIIFETSAGQGTQMGKQFQELKELYDQFTNEQKKHIRFCIDTCHVFVAGYNISSSEGVIEVFKEFDKTIGLDNVSVIHLNDSKVACGSCKDRHEELGFGHIGMPALLSVVKIAKTKGIPLIMETKFKQKSVEEQIYLCSSKIKT